MVDEGENTKKATNEYKKQYIRRERKEKNIDVKINEGGIKNKDGCEADKRKKNMKEVVADSKKLTKEEELRRILSSVGDDINKEESDRNKVAETLKSKDVENVGKKEVIKPNLKVKLTKFGGGGQNVPLEIKDTVKPGNDKNKSTVEGTNKHVDVDGVAAAKLGKHDTLCSASALEKDEQISLKNVVSNVVSSIEKEHNMTAVNADSTIVGVEVDVSISKKGGAVKVTKKGVRGDANMGVEVDERISKKDGVAKGTKKGAGGDTDLDGEVDVSISKKDGVAKGTKKSVGGDANVGVEVDESISNKDVAAKGTKKSDGGDTNVGGEIDGSISKKGGAAKGKRGMLKRLTKMVYPPHDKETEEGNKNIEKATSAENRKRKIQNEDKLKRNQEGNTKVSDKAVNDEETELRKSSRKPTQIKKPKLNPEAEKKKRGSPIGKKQKVNQESENMNLIDDTGSEEDGYDESSHAGRKKSLSKRKRPSKPKKVGKVESKLKKLKDSLPGLRPRAVPNQLIEAIGALSKKQREAVKNIGFGKILTLKVDKIPAKLGHFVVDNFDQEIMAIDMGDDKKIEVDDDVVHQLLGVPNAGVELQIEKTTKSFEGIQKVWLDRYTDDQMSPAEIVDKIKDNPDDDGIMFQIDFVILFLNTIVAILGNGKCKLNVLHRLVEDVDIKDINWCHVITQYMKECKNGWRRCDKTSKFNGAVTILLLLYVDRIAYPGFSSDRKISPLKFWTSEKLSNREDAEILGGGFGSGVLQDLHIDSTNYELNSKEDDVNEEESELMADARVIGMDDGMQGRDKQFVMQIPNNKVDIIIGKNGETIKSMQINSGARIQVIPTQMPHSDSSTERTLQIDGTDDQIEAAKQLVKEIIGENIMERLVGMLERLENNKKEFERALLEALTKMPNDEGVAMITKRYGKLYSCGIEENASPQEWTQFFEKNIIEIGETVDAVEKKKDAVEVQKSVSENEQIKINEPLDTLFEGGVLDDQHATSLGDDVTAEDNMNNPTSPTKDAEHISSPGPLKSRPKMKKKVEETVGPFLPVDIKTGLNEVEEMVWKYFLHVVDNKKMFEQKKSTQEEAELADVEKTFL
ncbi:hypothetical protein SSX86_030181 [Deinandra increscens subsp. villosa]|uniref:K Homology domain-containing protein n=1 Tax=Deinandra increscens subsp. villosa TaxID=3103831 RepID=A0AAP0GJW7_9ASTR